MLSLGLARSNSNAATMVTHRCVCDEDASRRKVNKAGNYHHAVQQRAKYLVALALNIYNRKRIDISEIETSSKI